MSINDSPCPSCRCDTCGGAGLEPSLMFQDCLLLVLLLPIPFKDFKYSLRNVALVHLLEILPVRVKLLAQHQHRLLPVGHQLLEVLVAQLLACPALTRTLPAALQFGFHVASPAAAAAPCRRRTHWAAWTAPTPPPTAALLLLLCTLLSLQFFPPFGWRCCFVGGLGALKIAVRVCPQHEGQRRASRMNLRAADRRRRSEARRERWEEPVARGKRDQRVLPPS